MTAYHSGNLCAEQTYASYLHIRNDIQYNFARFKIGHTPPKFPPLGKAPPPASSHIMVEHAYYIYYNIAISTRPYIIYNQISFVNKKM